MSSPNAWREAGTLTVIVLHLWRRNALFSIIGGTAAYMAMVQLGWSP